MPSPESYFVGGILAADGSLRPDITPSETMAALGRLVDPATVWCTALPVVEGWSTFDAAVAHPPASWVVPEPDAVAAAEPVLRDGWAHVERLMDRPVFVQPVVRVMTHSEADARAIGELGSVGGVPVSAFVPAAMGDWTWRWPLRVGVIAPDPVATAAALEGNGYYREHFDVQPWTAGRLEPLDVLVVDWRLADAVMPGDVGVVGAVIVSRPGDDPSITPARQVAQAVRPGAVIEVGGDDFAWFEEFVRELSHDRPVDVAARLARADAFVVADPEFVATTSVRNWARLVADAAHRVDDTQLADRLLQLVDRVEFEHERGGARELAAAVREHERDGSVLDVVGSPAVRAAGDLAPEEESEPAEDDRRLIARVSDARGRRRTNGFVAGRVHRLDLRIASAAGDGETAAEAPLPSPDPGADVSLTVTVHVEGSSKRLPSVDMVHPAAGDGDWTDTPVSFTAPKRSGDLRLFITVEWRGRVIQSATLSGPLHDPDDADGPGEIRLDVDNSSGVDGLDDRPGADATIIQTSSRSGRPIVIDAQSVVSIDPSVLQKANSRVRRALIDAFQRPPSSLADAARELADLAVRGSLLRDALRGKETTFFDDADWVHVTSFGGPPINYELIYTHAMPTSDNPKVCGPARNGARECVHDCSERQRDDRVCPFGFWATTKIVERRLHAPGRDDTSASDGRVVSVRRGGAVAVTDAANIEDSTAGTRIADAVAGFVEPGTSVVAATWSELRDAMSSPRQLVCLVTHTIDPDDPDDDLGVELQLGAETRKLHLVDRAYVNPELRTPGPVVLALGCDTATISASFAGFVSRLHSLGAEIVVSAISQIPGKEAADFVERFTAHLDRQLDQPGEHRFGEVMTAVRAETLLEGDVLALALTASGDGDVRLRGGT